jgi:hypothetical protein
LLGYLLGLDVFSRFEVPTAKDTNHE